MPKVLQKVPSSVAVLCSRGAIEEATGRSLAPKWSVLGAFGGSLKSGHSMVGQGGVWKAYLLCILRVGLGKLPGVGFLDEQAQNERSIGGGGVGKHRKATRAKYLVRIVKLKL